MALANAIATDLCEALVARGTPFRDAYVAVGRLVASQRAAGKRLSVLTAADLQAVGLDPAVLDALDLASSAEKRAAKF